MKLNHLIFSVLLLLFLFTGSGLASNSLHLVWLIIDQLSLEELLASKTPNIDYLQQRGAFGLMNVRTAGHLQPESTYLSAGTGNRSQGSKKSHIGKGMNQGVINPQIKELSLLNQKNTYQSRPGFLGKICRENGITIAVLGNTDTLKGEKRTIVSMVMDEKGYIPLGDVSKGVLQRVNQPWGYLTDWAEIKNKFLEYKDRTEALVLETGDLTRLEDYADEISRDRLNREKEAALKRIDDFLGFLLEEIDLNHTQLGIIVPTPPLAAQLRGSRLSFLLISGKDFNQGWLSSLTTKRKGIVTISDLLATFVKGTGIRENIPTIGNPIYFSKEKVEWRDILGLNNRITLISNLRPLFIKAYIVIQMLVIILAIVNLIWNKLNSMIIIPKLIEYLLLSLFLIPINYLIISNLNPSSIGFMTLLLIGLTGIEIIFLVKIFKSRLIQIVIITSTLVLIIIIDLIKGGFLLPDSLLGYSSIIGARYYGLGNEYMGLFIGSVLISTTALIEFLAGRKSSYLIRVKCLIIPLYSLMIYFLGAANLGANFGGMITAIFAFGISWLYLNRFKLTYLRIVRIFSLFILILVGIIYLDYMQVIGPSTHIGRAVALVIKGDWQGILRIIYRKLVMNLKLLRWTAWTQILLAFIIYLIFLFQHPVGKLKRILKVKPYLAAGFYGGLAGGVITMLVNDSGVVAAATILFYPMLTLLDFIR